MYFILGNLRLEVGDYHNAIQLFKHARARIRYDTSQALSVVSLVSFLMNVSKHIKTDGYHQ